MTSFSITTLNRTGRPLSELLQRDQRAARCPFVQLFGKIVFLNVRLLTDEDEAMRLSGPQILDNQLDHWNTMYRNQRLEI